MADQEFKINVISTADNSGYQSAAKAQQDLTGETRKSAEVLTDEAAPAVEHLTGLHRELHAAVHAVGTESPLAAAAISASMLGAAGAIYAAVELFRAAKTALKDYNDELDKQADFDFGDHAQRIKDLEDDWINAQKALGDYLAKLQHAGDDKDAIKTQLDNIKAVKDAQIKANEETIKSWGEIQIARLKSSGASQQEINDAKKRTADAVDALEDQKNNTVAEKIYALQVSNANAAPLHAAVQSAQENQYAAKVNQTKDEDDFKLYSDILDPKSDFGKRFQAQRDAAQKKLDDAKAAEPEAIQAFKDSSPGATPDEIARGVKSIQDSFAKTIADAQEAVTAVENQARQYADLRDKAKPKPRRMKKLSGQPRKPQTPPWPMRTRTKRAVKNCRVKSRRRSGSKLRPRPGKPPGRILPRRKTSLTKERHHRRNNNMSGAWRRPPAVWR